MLPDALISDIRTIATICRDREPDPALESIENIVPVTNQSLAEDLDADLEVLLSWPADDAAENLSPVVPMALLDDFTVSQSLEIRIGTAVITADHLDLEDILRRTRLQLRGSGLQRCVPAISISSPTRMATSRSAARAPSTGWKPPSRGIAPVPPRRRQVV